jgi:hypothetical protein
MSAVPGRAIDACTSGVTPAAIVSAAAAFTSAFERYWLSGRRHGDLGLSNVLFDFGRRTISVIDAGTRDSCRTCSESEKFSSGRAADLAHALCDVVRDITDLTGRPLAHMNRDTFVKALLAIAVEGRTSVRDRQLLLRQIWECFEEHLVESFGSSWSVKGAPHQAARMIARSRARSIIEDLMPNDHVDSELHVARQRMSLD